jgi:putative transposase
VAHKKGTTVAGRLTSLIKEDKLRQDAKRLGFVQRQRKLDVWAFIWTLVLGFDAGRERTMTALQRAYHLASGKTVVWSTFSAWFRPALVPLMRGLVVDLLSLTTKGLHSRVSGLLTKFRDLLAIDTVVIRLHDSLEKRFRACRTNHTKAAAKMHTILSVLGTSASSVKITSERVNDRTPFTRIGQWVQGRLLLFDLGYYSYWLFDRIDQQGGWFISRLKSNTNPRIVATNRLWRGRAVPVVGERLQDFLGKLERDILDVVVEVRVPRRVYRGKSRRVRRTFRVVGVRNDVDGTYHLYITNVPADVLSAEDVSAVYATRWSVELLFRELGVRYRLKDQPSANPVAVQSLIYAALLSLVASRRLHAFLSRRLHHEAAARVGHERVASAFAQFAILLLPMVAQRGRVVLSSKTLERILGAAAIDPHLARPDLLMRVDQGQQISYMRAAQEAALAA